MAEGSSLNPSDLPCIETDLAGGPDGLPDGEVDEHPGEQQGQHQRDPDGAEVSHPAGYLQHTPAETRGKHSKRGVCEIHEQ